MRSTILVHFFFIYKRGKLAKSNIKSKNDNEIKKKSTSYQFLGRFENVSQKKSDECLDIFLLNEVES